MNFQPEYGIPILLAALVMVAFPAGKTYTNEMQKKEYLRMQLFTLLFAVIGMKLAVAIGDHGWPLREIPDWSLFLYSGRSIAGALLLGFVGTEVMKRLLNYSLAPNDRFAVTLALSIAIGRVGCLLSGCCAGVEYDGLMAAEGADGKLRFPSQLLEISFHLTACGVLYYYWKNQKLLGYLFAYYLMAYGVFRLVSESMRITPDFIASISGYQLMAIAMIISAAMAIYIRKSKTGNRNSAETV